MWSDIWRFDRSFWYVIGLCVTFYAVIFPFRSTFAIKYFQHAHGLSLQDAGQINGFVFLAAIFATPAFGWLVDKIGHRALFMAGGTLLLFLAFPILAYTGWNLWVTTVLIGIAFSLVPAVMWPAVPYLVEPNRLGTAYGLMTMLQNIGMMTINLAAGQLNDSSRASGGKPRRLPADALAFRHARASAGSPSPGCCSAASSARRGTTSSGRRRGRRWFRPEARPESGQRAWRKATRSFFSWALSLTSSTRLKNSTVSSRVSSRSSCR